MSDHTTARDGPDWVNRDNAALIARSLEDADPPCEVQISDESKGYTPRVTDEVARAAQGGDP